MDKKIVGIGIVGLSAAAALLGARGANSAPPASGTSGGGAATLPGGVGGLPPNRHGWISERPSEHFSWSEAITTSQPTPQEPTTAQQKEIRWFAVEVLEPFRSWLSEKLGRETPIKINSWWRSAETNKAIGGSSTSDHMSGTAVDLSASGLTDEDLIGFLWAAKQGGYLPTGSQYWDQVITYTYTGHLHLGARETGARLQFLTAYKDSTGKTAYKGYP